MPPTTKYYQHDLTTEPTEELVDKLLGVQQVVIGIRPPLVTNLGNKASADHNDLLVQGLDVFLTALTDETRIQSMLHISSIAAINHLEAQVEVKEADDLRVPSEDLQAPYDRFKRACEEVVDDIAEMHNIPTTTLRLGAIFSDHAACIQCSALKLQARVGCYLPTYIDCNSSANVVAAIMLVLDKQAVEKNTAHDICSYYYYTRPVCDNNNSRMVPDDGRIPYGQYLQDYRTANDIQWAIWIPVILVKVIVTLVHLLAAVFFFLPYVQSVDYLLQVSAREHSFDCGKFEREFGISAHEETIEECFRRRRRQLEEQQQATNNVRGRSVKQD